VEDEMEAITIAGVPAVITRANYLEMIKSLGIDPDHLLEMRWGWNTITAVVFALDEEGNRYADQATMDIAKHEISIRISDDTPCPHCSRPEGWDACPVHRDGTPTPEPEHDTTHTN
jgi:hypothetical protein